MDFKNYDPARVTVTFKGVPLLGFGEGTFVSIERTEDAFSMKVGAQGDVTRSRKQDRTGSVTVMLQQASPTNDALSAIHAEDELFGTGYGALLVKDLNGTTIADSENAWIRKLPVGEYADEASDREWVFDCADLNFHVGGSVA